MDEDEEINDDVERAGAILSPEGIVMLPMAIFLDLIGLVLTIISILTLFGVLALEIPEIVNWISDGLGFAFFGLWVMFRTPFHQGGTDVVDLGEGVMQKQMAIKKGKEGMEKVLGEYPEIEASIKGMSRRQYQTAEEAAKAAKAAPRTAAQATKRSLRFGVAFLGEIIPFVGAFPFWTWFVYSELKR